MTSVLVVEDDPWIQWMIADDLTDRGYEVVTAGDGFEGLLRIAQGQPHVVVLDLVLPGMSGQEFAQRYTSITHGATIPIVVVTALLHPSLPRGAHDIQRCLSKPLDLEELARAIAQAAGPLRCATPA